MAAHVMLRTEEQSLRLDVTNLQSTLTTWMTAEVVEPGAVAVPFKILNDLVATLPAQQLELRTGDEEEDEEEAVDPRLILTVETLRGKAHIRGGDPAEFPPIPRVAEDDDIEVDPEEFCNAIRRTEFCASREETRPVLTGVNLKFSGSEFIMAGADGYRLAEQRGALDNPAPEDLEINIPARFMAELNRIRGNSEEPIRISLPRERNQALFRLNAGSHGGLPVEMTTVLLHGDYPDYRATIPRSNDTRVLFDGETMLQAVRSGSVFARNGRKIITLYMRAARDEEPPVTVIYGMEEETGDSSTTVEMEEMTGEDMEISFNQQYISQMLQTLQKRRIRLEARNGETPGTFRIEDSEEYTHVIMPIITE